jgi:protein gp37
MEIQRDLAAGRINLMKAQEDLARIRGAHVGDKSGGSKKSTKDNTNYDAIYGNMTDEEKAKYAKQLGIKTTTGSGTDTKERSLSAADRKAIAKAKMGQNRKFRVK